MTATSTQARSASRIGALMAMGSMVSVQLGLAIAVGLIDRIGVEGAAWIRWLISIESERAYTVMKTIFN